MNMYLFALLMKDILTIHSVNVYYILMLFIQFHTTTQCISVFQLICISFELTMLTNFACYTSFRDYKCFCFPLHSFLECHVLSDFLQLTAMKKHLLLITQYLNIFCVYDTKLKPATFRKKKTKTKKQQQPP